jgi:hypothetical protein
LGWRVVFECPDIAWNNFAGKKAVSNVNKEDRASKIRFRLNQSLKVSCKNKKEQGIPNVNPYTLRDPLFQVRYSNNSFFGHLFKYFTVNNRSG